VICEPTRPKWWGTGRRSPRIQDLLQIPLRGKWHVDSGAVGVGEGTRAGGQCAKDRATARGEKINLIIAVARAGEGQQIPRPSPMVPSWHTKKEKGRFGVGAGLRGQILDRPPILKRSVGPSKAPLAYRPTSSLPNPPGQVKRKKG
jgi:hypothetical protein